MPLSNLVGARIRRNDRRGGELAVQSCIVVGLHCLRAARAAGNEAAAASFLVHRLQHLGVFSCAGAATGPRRQQSHGRGSGSHLQTVATARPAEHR